MADTPTPLKKFLDETKQKQEVIELARDNAGNNIMGTTDYPNPFHAYRFILEDFNKSAEEIYFWIHDYIQVSEGFPHVKKITDSFSGSEHSSFFGSAQQRLGAQQEKVSMFLATVGKMVKELFQIVREVRVIDERLDYYKDSFDRNSKSRENADIVLKGIWVDMVEQGAKNPASVYGMARELQFTTLPDLFFTVCPPTIEEIDKEVEKLEYNRKLKEVLRRKLRGFMQWKVTTYKELQNRRIFTIKYLRQHFSVIRLYLSWIKPYLRNVKRLTMEDKTEDADMISAFEGSLMEVENIYYKLPPSHGESKFITINKSIHSVVIINFKFRTKPSMNYQQEYQRGPIHIGHTEVNMRAYVWDKATIDKYVQMRQKEDLELIGEIDGGVKAAMESLGDELERYLREAGEDITFEKKAEKKDEKADKKKALMNDPFVALLYGFKEITFDPIFSGLKTKKKDGITPAEKETEIVIAKEAAKRGIWQTYKNFKKGHGMLAW